ncbi:16S rRNA (cytosine(967)-C(5))-methyltransferase [Synechococcus sp. PCC 7335]|uniref:16S rRNA (cytosine(967)-C(5))-methyltransferase n=1 Tax=Synechococcus sp. (strain ATCC 29403 / PCC 7335) TaxID=91464 RepID=UPI001D0D36EE|nr:16S rRNA (cytosine(967)-C(5))-methyltransferase [Synechococcus sp. PCC 7335]
MVFAASGNSLSEPKVTPKIAKSKTAKPKTARQIAFEALRAIDQGAFADVVIDRKLKGTQTGTQLGIQLSSQDKGLVTELVYGSVRRRRTLDALIDQFGKRPASKQHRDLLQILRLGFYQLRYLDHVPVHAVVDTTVQLAKSQRLGKLSGVVNAMLRQYAREAMPAANVIADPLKLPEERTRRLGILHSYPDWIIDVWRSMLPDDQVEALCEYFNRSPYLELRINLQRQSLSAAIALFADAGIEALPIEGVPSALRLTTHAGAVTQLPGYAEGWWAVQDSSAQLVSYLLDPQPGEVIIDACAAPGGKSLHIAELMRNEGTVWSCDRTSSRTKKIQQNIDRLGATIVRPIMGDSRNQPTFLGQGDRVLLDVPCSGLGTLNRHADARWRQTPDSVDSLVTLQQEILMHASTWVKPGGVLVYATCTLHPQENEAQIKTFLSQNAGWTIEAPPPSFGIEPTEAGWIKVWPHIQHMDGFFIVKLRRATT